MDIIRTLYYIQGALGDENIFCCFICVTLVWALHIVIKRQFFTFIFYIRRTSAVLVVSSIIFMVFLIEVYKILTKHDIRVNLFVEKQQDSITRGRQA